LSTHPTASGGAYSTSLSFESEPEGSSLRVEDRVDTERQALRACDSGSPMTSIGACRRMCQYFKTGPRLTPNETSIVTL